MKDDGDKGEGQTGGRVKKPPAEKPRKNPRADRLKLALRENLKRRKSQARGRDAVTMPLLDDNEVLAHRESGKKPGE
jgi:hypothetical protein